MAESLEIQLIRGVIFDLDGVLVATDEAHYRAWKWLADEEGIPFDRMINQRLKGVGRMDSLNIILERATRVYSAEEETAMAERKNAAFQARLAKLTSADVLPGARRLLDDLRYRGIKIAVASSSKNARLILDRLGLRGGVDAVADGNDVTHSKPHPEVFLLAAERLGLPPRACLVLEDARAGTEAGRRAGMAVFGIGTPQALPGVEHLAPGLVGVTVDLLLAIQHQQSGPPPGA